MIIFAVLIIIPYNQIFVCDFIGIKESDLKGDQTYEDFNLTFYNDYEKINPMTKKEAIQRFLEKLLKNGLISKPDYDKIIKNIDKVNLMETYYKARKNFAESLLLKAFMNIPETDNKNKNKKRKPFLERLKEHSRANRINIINLLLSHINPNNNINNSNTINYDEINNLIQDNNKKGKRGTRGQKSNSLINFGNQINGNISGINTNTFGNNININININISSNDNNDESSDKNKNNKKRTSLSKKNMDIFAHLIKTEQKKILSYYRNPVLFSIKKMCEGIIFHNNHDDEEEEEEEKKDNKDHLSNIEEINLDENNINEHNEANTINENKNIEVKKKKKIKIKIKKKIKVKKKIPKKKLKNTEMENK